MLFYNSNQKKRRVLVQLHTLINWQTNVGKRCCRCVTHTGLRDEEKSRWSAGDGFHVFFIVVAVVAYQQIVEDAHNAHQEQEEDDSFSKEVAGGATKEIFFF